MISAISQLANEGGEMTNWRVCMDIFPGGGCHISKPLALGRTGDFT